MKMRAFLELQPPVNKKVTFLLIYFIFVTQKINRMKQNKSLFLAFGLLVIVGSVFRIAGFAPQLAMAVFGAVVIKDKKLAFLLPLVSMFISDVLFEVLFRFNYVAYGGFYEGQLTNYILLAGITLVGFWARNLNFTRIVVAVIAAPVIYFLLSNFFVWQAGAGLQRPKTFNGLLMCYNDAIPFFRSGLINTIFFSIILFGGYFLVQRIALRQRQLA